MPKDHIKGESLADVKLALGLGFHIHWKQWNGLNFAKGNRHVWKCVIQDWNKIGWQTADMDEAGAYRNHKPYRKLNEALERTV